MSKAGKLLFAIGALGLSVGLTACSSNSKDTSSSTRTEVKFFNGKTESVSVMNKMIKQFNAQNKKYKVVQEFQKDASSALQTKFASGDVPDVVSADITQDYIDNGLFENLSKDDFWTGVDPSIKQLVTDTKSGKQYKVALAKSIGGIFYNKDLVKNVRTDTWAHFIKSIKTNKAGITPMYLGGKDSWTLGQMMEFMGHGSIKQDYSMIEAKKVFINNDQSVLKFAKTDGPISTFATRLMEMKKDGIINQNAATASYDDQVTAFATGKAVCVPQGIWAISEITKKNPKMNIGFAAFPPMENGKKAMVLSGEDSTMGIPAKSKNKAGAKAFIKFLLEKKNLKKYSETLHLPSAYTTVKANWIENSSAYDKVLNTAKPIGFTSFPSGFSSDDNGRYVQAELSGQYKTVADFTKAYTDAWNKAWKANN